MGMPSLRKSYGWSLLIFVWVGLFALTINLSAAAADVPLYGLFETNIDYQDLKGTAHSYVDPFYGIGLQATFTSPSGNQVSWWGFYDGDGAGGQTGNVWKIRFMPDELGAWTFSWTFSDGSLRGSGAFQAVDTVAIPRKPGPLRHDSTIHQWFVSADQSRHVFPNMYASWTTPSNAEPHLNPESTLGEVKSNEFDVMVLWSPMYHQTEPLDATNPMIFLDTTDYVPRLQGWHLLENGIYQQAYDDNVYIYQWDGFYSGNNLYRLYQKSTSFQNKVLKYWIVRNAPYYMVLYNICFECGEFVSIPSWPVERANYVKSIDPWDHMITAHEDRAWNYGKSSVIDFSALQQDGSPDDIGYIDYFKGIVEGVMGYWYPRFRGSIRGMSFHDIALTIWNAPSAPHPHCSECIWNFAGWQEPGTEESHRKDLWDGITGGMSYFLWAVDNSIGLTSFKHANTFLKSEVKWWTMSPHDEVVISGKAYVLAKIGVEYLVYSSSGNRFVLSLPEGSYQWRWFDPANAVYNDSVMLKTSFANVPFNKPNNKDWVLHIEVIFNGHDDFD